MHQLTRFRGLSNDDVSSVIIDLSDATAAMAGDPEGKQRSAAAGQRMRAPVSESNRKAKPRARLRVLRTPRSQHSARQRQRIRVAAKVNPRAKLKPDARF
jgi:hypothetical protein